MKHLPKHLQPRWRYLAVEIESWPDVRITRWAFQRALWYAGRDLLGDPGSADADLKVVEFDYAEGAGEAIVRTRRGEVEAARAAVACVAAVDGDPVCAFVRGVSGTVRACEEKYLGATAEPESTDVVYHGERRSAVVRGDAVDLRDDTFTGATTLDMEGD